MSVCKKVLCVALCMMLDCIACTYALPEVKWSSTGAINSPAIAFIFPCLAYSWVYRTPQARASCTLLPPNFMRKWDWAPIFVLNLFIVLWFLVNGVGFGIAYSTIQIVDDVKTFHVFAECYQCPAKSALSGSG